MQQEPRLLSAYANDLNMINAYREGKDLYATIATGIYHNTYWDNMEKHEDGSPNPDGKKRRSSVKGLLLGIMYGMGPASLAEAIKGTIQEAQNIIDEFYASYPKVKEWIDKTHEDAKKNLYVEDFYGRRRRLSDLGLPEYDIKYKNADQNISIDFNPLIGSKGLVGSGKNDTIAKYRDQLAACKYKGQVKKIKDQALLEGIEIFENGGKISRAERQCVNARIQGGAATMSKIAMRKVYDSQELRDLGFSLLLQVHDELIGECPAENADRVAELLTDIMKNSVSDLIVTPFKCDPSIVTCWYEDDYGAELCKEYNGYMESGMTENEAFIQMSRDHVELTTAQLTKMLSENS